MCCSTSKVIYAARIVAVRQLEAYPVCINCKRRVIIEPKKITPALCPKCQTEQNTTYCTIVKCAQLTIHDDISTVRVTAYDDILKTLTKPRRVTELNLLEAQRFTATYNACDHHLMDIYRPDKPDDYDDE